MNPDFTPDERRNQQIERIFKFLDSVTLSGSIEDFVGSLEEYYENKKTLTDKQYEALLNIYERV